MLRRLKAVFRMLRLRALMVIVIFGCFGILSAGVSLENALPELFLVVAILAMWYLNGTCINDLSDEAIDRINLKDALGRPLANKKVSRKLISLSAGIAGVACLILAAFIGMPAIMVIIFALGLNWIYSMPPIRISGRGVLATLLLPLGYVVLPYMLAALTVHAHFNWQNFELILGVYISFSGRIVLKDYRDVRGDRMYGKRTFIVRYGSMATVMFSSIFFCVGSSIVALYFLKKNGLVSAIILAHLFCILWALQKLNMAKKPADQQIIIGSIARIATTGLICMITALDFMPGIANYSLIYYQLFITAIAFYGAWQSVYFILHTKEMKLVY